MKKVLHFDAPRDWYRCDAAVVWCFDCRFEMTFRKLLKRMRIVNYDAIRVAGGAKILGSPERESEREFAVDQIRKSIRLHDTRLIVLMVHSDCGAYGGLAAFGGDGKAEARHHADELRKAAAFLHTELPELSIVSVYVDFEGVWTEDSEAFVDTQPVSAPMGSAARR